ncbi:hypothetical protein C723_1950 [Christiangramia flava JLT2011]|nr:hypothetical protein C723_1950 [Christiangramia flava JLT2011]
MQKNIFTASEESSIFFIVKNNKVELNWRDRRITHSEI